MAITITRDLNMVPVGVPPVIHLSQYDDDFSLVFNLYSSVGMFTVESSTTAEIRGTKEDGYGYSANATIDISNKRVTVAGNNQMTACAGQNTFELVLKKNNKVLSTVNFILDVERAALDAGTITDQSVLKELNAIIASAATATQAAEDAEDAADRAEEAAQTLEIDDTLTHAGQAADAKKTGDEISALRDDLSQIEPGLSETAKQALLVCFQHVAWTDVDSQTYYDALEDALYEGSKKLERIDATYTAEGHTVYQFTPVESLKYYIVVTAYYSDNTTETITDYTLTGTLDSATSILTITYGSKTTQINVTVSIDANLAYFVPAGTVLDGSASSGFDTGVKLVDSNKSVSIIADVTDEEILSRVRTIMLLSDRDATSGASNYQVSLSSTESSGTYQKKYNAIGSHSNSESSDNQTNAVHRVKVAMIHYSNSNTFTLYLDVDGNVYKNWISVNGIPTISNQTLFIGKRPDGGYQWKGTVNLLNVYTRGLPLSEAKALLGVA